MHFGRIKPEALDRADLSLAADSPRTRAFLALPWQGQQKIYAGCPVWADQKWVGLIYPPEAKLSSYLPYYASRFPTVELNASFYHLPSATQLGKWAGQTPQSFRFAPKVHRDISEKLDLGQWRPLLKEYCELISLLQERLGIAFMQLPSWFSGDRLRSLSAFLQAWPRELPLAVEFRHRSWFDNHSLRDEAINLLYRHKVSAVITDTPGARYALHLSLCWPKVMIRFMGGDAHPSDALRLKAWAERLTTWLAAGLDEAYFFVHQAAHELIPSTLDQFTQSFLKQDAGNKKRLQQNLPPPPPPPIRSSTYQPSLGF